MPDWSKLGKSSRRRGHSFERDIAKKLNGLIGSKFNRTPASGGHAIAGDLYEAPGSQTIWSRVTWYCRTGYCWTWEGLLNGAKCGPREWALETGMGAFWVFRVRPGAVFVMMNEHFMSQNHHVNHFNLEEGYVIISLESFVLIQHGIASSLRKYVPSKP